MPVRMITVEGATWRVMPSGLVTQYDRDEFGLRFSRARADGTTEIRTTRYSPGKARSRERSFVELSDAELTELLQQSQPAETSPEARYGTSPIV